MNRFDSFWPGVAVTSAHTTMQFRDILVARFQEIFATEGGCEPEWAWKYKPPIPLIGERVARNSSVLIYGSATNIDVSQSLREKYYAGEQWDRYRNQYRENGYRSTAFFSEDQMSPVENGRLLVLALFVSHRCNFPVAEHPRDFVEHVAVSNWGKFTISGPTNSDYATDSIKLRASLRYVEAELMELQPKIVVLPSQIWSHKELAAVMRRAVPAARFIPMMQFNPTVANCHTKRYADAAHVLSKESLGTSLQRWITELKGFKPENVWRFLAHVDARISSCQGRSSQAPHSPIA